MDINFKAPLNVSQAFAKNVVAHSVKGATIVNISSIASRRPAPECAVYCCSKAAVEMLTKSLAAELGPYDIRVNSVLPTLMLTNLHAHWPQEIKDKIPVTFALDRAPIKGILDTEDTANLVLYLSSKESNMITGAGVAIDGGITVV